MNSEDSNEIGENDTTELGFHQVYDSLFQEGSDYKQLIKDMQRITSIIQEKHGEDKLFKDVYEIGHPKFTKEFKDDDLHSEISIDSDLSGDEDYWNGLEST